MYSRFVLDLTYCAQCIVYRVFVFLFFVQQIFSLSKADYDAQKVASNRTFQHTVSDALDGVFPADVTDIVVKDNANRVTNMRSTALTVSSVTVTYTLQVLDSTQTLAKLRTQLVQAANDGTMDSNFRHYAVVFNVTNFNNVTFAAPHVTHAAAQRDSSERLTGAMIALVVVGVLVGLALLVGVLLFVYYRQEVTPITTVSRRREVQQV